MGIRSGRLCRAVVAALTLGVFVWPSTSVMAASTNITTVPASENQVITPGTSKSFNLQLLNNGTQAQSISVILQTFGSFGVQGSAAIQPFAKNDPAQSYVSFSKTSFVAQPGVWNSVVMTINLPKTAQLGYYYAVVFKPTIPSAVPGQNLNILTASNAILVLVDTRSGNEFRQVKLVSFDTNKKLYDYLPVTFNVSVHNAGNIYLAPVGQIFVTRDSEFKNVISTVDVNDGRGNVLPNSSRTFNGTWQDGFPVYVDKQVSGKPVYDASGKAVQQLKWDFSQTHKFRFGKYYAHLVLVYNNGVRDIPIESSLSFWVIPWVTLIIVLIVGLVLIMGLVLLAWVFLRGGHRLFSSSRSRKSYRRR